MTLNLTKPHLYYIDLLRVYLTIVVFYHHSAIAFGASGSWYYRAKELVSSNVEGLLSINMAVDQSYFMSLFFFISAYLMPASYDKKGCFLYIKDRINRLVIPLLIYSFIINPLLCNFIYGAKYEIGLGPMWFVFTLIFFELFYVLYRVINSRITIPWRFPKILPINIFILLMGLWAFEVRLFAPTNIGIMGLTLGYFPLYISMYFLGIVAYRNNWLDGLKIINGYIWLSAILFLIMPLFLLSLKDCPNLNLVNGGLNRFALIYALWEPVMCVAICYILLVFSKKYFNRKSSLIDWLSKQTYSFYIIHPAVVVGCTYFVETINVSPFQRFLLLLIIGIPLCFIVGYLFKKVLRLIDVNI